MSDTVENRTLCLLAKRKNPSFDFKTNVHWIRLTEFENDSKHYSCLICNSILWIQQEWGYSSEPSAIIKEHAIKHLKEYNLLPFL